MAWLTDSTKEVVNTFTVGDINIDLKEHEFKYTETTGTGALTENEVLHNNYLFVPGAELAKDPFITVEEGSEACWLFVKVDEKNNTDRDSTEEGVDKIIDWDIDSTAGWEKVAGTNNVWFIKVDQKTAIEGKVYNVLADKKITVSPNVTKDMVDDINGVIKEGSNKEYEKQPAKPQLIFTAYAIQSANLKSGETVVNTAAAAWELVKPTNP